MSELKNKIDFAALIQVTKANPNGDPLNGNRPRTDYRGYGEISDVCIKRKIRNRLQDMGECIFVQSDDRRQDEYKSLSDRAKASLDDKKSREEFAKEACEKWIDVRTFGQVFAYGGKKKNEEGAEGVSVGVRGPVSVHQAVSCSPVDIDSMQITKSVNGETTKDGSKSSDTMGTKHFVEFGLYIVKGSINVQLAKKTGFSREDADKIKEALKTLFVNDASSARPDGSMEVVKLFWWEHDNEIGQYPSARVHNLLSVKQKDAVKIPVSADDYEIVLGTLPGLEVEEIEGF